MGACVTAPGTGKGPQNKPPRDIKHEFVVGETVKVRMADCSPWRVGQVVSSSPLQVKPEDWTCSYKWRFVEPLHSAEDVKRKAEPERRQALMVEVQPCSFEQRPSFLCSTGPEQLQVPPHQWSLRISQFKEFTGWCMAMPQYEQVKSIHGFVNDYHIGRLFINPLTREAGCSIALLLNGGGLDAHIMISHAWGEAVDEALEALNSAMVRYKLLHDTPIWWCPFSVYQPGEEEGATGPTIAQQLALEPFKCVINSAFVRESAHSNVPGMLVIHTSKEDVYRRLWCVHEIHEALLLDPPLNVQGIASKAWIRNPLGGVLAAFQVETESAKCGFPADQRMLQEQIRSYAGGFQHLNEEIRKFRLRMIEVYALETSRKSLSEQLELHLKIGGTVRVRDSVQAEFLNAQITSVQPLRARPDGWTSEYGWGQLELPKVVDRIGSRHECPMQITQLPTFLSLKDAPHQLDIPKHKWSISFGQIKLLHQWLLATEEIATIVSWYGFVHMYDIHDVFLQPSGEKQTCSIALVFNKDEPLVAKLFVSHVWAEPVDELDEVLSRAQAQRDLPSDTPLYLCAYSNWQKKSELAKQNGDSLNHTPFYQSLQSALKYFGMIVVCTSTTPCPWHRIWCAWEMSNFKVADKPVDVVLSRSLLIDPPNGFSSFVDVRTEFADVPTGDQAEQVQRKINDAGGFSKLNIFVQKSTFQCLRAVAEELDRTFTSL